MNLRKVTNPFGKPFGVDDSVVASSLSVLTGEGSVSDLGNALAGGSGSGKKAKGNDDDDDDAWGG